MASLIHDTSPILIHSLQQSHNKGLYYGFRDVTLSRLVIIIKHLVHHAVYCIILLSFLWSGAHEGLKLESQKEQQTRLSFLKIINHILTGIIIIYIQKCRHPSLLFGNI